MLAGNHNGGKKTYFSIAKTVEEKRGQIFCKELNEFFAFVQGWLIGVDKVDGEYEGEKTYQVKFTFVDLDTGEIGVLQCGRYSSFGKDAILRLAEIAQDGHVGYVMFNPYSPQPDANSNGKRFVHCSIRHRAEPPEDLQIGLSGKFNEQYKVKWKTPLEEIPKPEIIQMPNPEDPTKTIPYKKQAHVQKFYDELIPKIVAKLLPLPRIAQKAKYNAVAVDEGDDTAEQEHNAITEASYAGEEVPF